MALFIGAGGISEFPRARQSAQVLLLRRAIESCYDGYGTRAKGEETLDEGSCCGAFSRCGMSFGSSAKCTTRMDSIFSSGDTVRELEPLSSNTHLVQSTEHEFKL